MNDHRPTQYERIAVAAVALAAKGIHPAAAWDAAAKDICASPSTADKRCPRSAFLGLAGAGAIVGVLPGDYCAASKNARYAEQALALLRADETLINQPRELWRRVLMGEERKYNQQMHVVTALWRTKKFVGQRA